MNLLSFEWAAILYLIAAVCFILALKGLSSPKTARRGNLIGAFGAFVALVTVFLSMRIDNLPWILLTIAIGSAIAAPVSRRVQMTQMPQLVALFNGVGGGAAALVAFLELSHSESPWSALAIAFTIMVGAVSFAGSCITFAKLQELMTTRPVTFPGQPVVMVVVVLGAIAAGAALVLTGQVWAAIVLLGLGLVAGVMLVLPVGGADVPIVISLLNAFTGLTVAASGLVLGNVLLLVAGTLVGASGTILTRAMASAMGRSVGGIIFGAFRGGSTAGSTVQSDRPVRSATPEDVAILLGYAEKVIVVPGYGLAVAQAQHTMAELATALEAKGIEVSFAIHPVAGRMPGHMNVLLAEANVPTESLKEMDEINPEFKTCDVALVVGANDVVNPAAKTTPGSPIYGMPILDVEAARQVVFLKRSMRPGFAGIENELLYEPQTTLLFGDAKDSLTKVLSAVKAL
ncbi:MAG: transhydrogenase subunit beta [Schumannella sp.]|nr:transhydrogenase subunit beta [Schumannella sp.]